jgi:hypothetical protein
MSRQAKSPPRLAVALALAVLLLLAGLTARAAAAGLEWRLEQPPPPEAERSGPIPLGRVGDIEFQSPNLGLLITAGNGSTIKPGVWAYTGRGWHELAIVCGASDGRIAWTGADEFWTISDGRPGQANGPQGQLPDLEDDTLCRFADGGVAESFATLAFQSNSYESMEAAGCIDPSDCWFGGDVLPQTSPPGAFHLHWNGRTMTAEPDGEEHAVRDMRPFDGHLYESVQLLSGERGPENGEELGNPSALHRIEPEEDLAANGGSPFALLFNHTELELPGEGNKFSYLNLGTDAEALWAAAGPSSEASDEQVTVLRKALAGEWKQVIGAKAAEEAEQAGESRGEPLPPAADPDDDAVTAIAAEPGSGGAWIALDTHTDVEHPSPTARALLAHISADGTVSEEQELPAEGTPGGAASKLTCPAVHDCWMVTTQGWLYHLAEEGELELPEDSDPAFSHLITFRPPDESTPEVPPVTLPVDDSGLLGEPPAAASALTEASSGPEARVTVPLLSNLHSRVVHGSTLELRFHLAVKARVRLLAKRRKSVVASTPMKTFAAGNRKLLLRLEAKRWPTKLDLETHALAPLPTVSVHGANTNTNTNTFTTSLVVRHTYGPLTPSLFP